MKFSEIVKHHFPTYAIRINVGGTITYMGRMSAGLLDLLPKQLEWLDTHKFSITYAADEVVLTFRRSNKYDQIVWG